MRERAFFILLLSLLPSLIFACSEEDGIFAYVINSRGEAAHKNVAGYKYEVAAEVFNRLVQARGDFQQPAPEFVMNDGRLYMAWMNPKKKEIGLEAAAYDLCTTFGADSLNALAALLAHEMTHYYQKHDWTRQFANANPNTEAAKKIGQALDGLSLETQADYLGGFLALSAGFDTYGVSPELLPRIYKAYTLPEQIPGYPPLSDRISFANNAVKLLQELSAVFQTANCLTVVGAYDDALAYYQMILKDYQSRELYNNLGVLDVLSALDYFSPKDMPYVLPLELDTESRLSRSSRGIDSIAVRNALLEHALAQFKRAADLDENYPAALLNRACAYLLLDEREDAAFWAGKAKKLGKKMKMAEEAADADVLLGIIAALNGEPEDAKAILQKAAAAGHPLAGPNLAVLTGESTKPDGVLGFTNNGGGVERLDGLLLSDFMAAPDFDLQVEVAKDIFCGLKQRPHSKIAAHYADEHHYAWFLMSAEDYDGATGRGIHLGDELDALLEKYPSGHRIVSSRQGTFLVYPIENIIFLLGSDGKVKQWMVYRMKRGVDG